MCSKAYTCKRGIKRNLSRQLILEKINIVKIGLQQKESLECCDTYFNSYPLLMLGRLIIEKANTLNFSKCREANVHGFLAVSLEILITTKGKSTDHRLPMLSFRNLEIEQQLKVIKRKWAAHPLSALVYLTVEISKRLLKCLYRNTKKGY